MGSAVDSQAGARRRTAQPNQRQKMIEKIRDQKQKEEERLKHTLKQLYTNDSERQDTEEDRDKSAVDEREGEGALYPELKNNLPAAGGTKDSGDYEHPYEIQGAGGAVLNLKFLSSENELAGILEEQNSLDETKQAAESLLRDTGDY